MRISRAFLAGFLLGVVPDVHAAKILVTWINPTHNERVCDSNGQNCIGGDLLTNLSHIHIEWGTCVAGSQPGTFDLGVVQSFVTVPQRPTATTSTHVYPSGLARVCVRAFAITTEGKQSDPSNVSMKELLPSPGKPVTLGKPVILEF